ncbi:transposable element Tcb1 transposase [Trichonephila clavipes]|nr:transposable element Tcb1 transposase [Trichonephila clavipes]
MDREAKSRVLIIELVWFARQQVSARTFDNVCSNESESYLQHRDGHIRAWRHSGESTLSACIRHHHTGLSPGVMQDNARPHVNGIVRTFLDTENVRLPALPARSLDLSLIENVWSKFAERLARHHTAVTMVDGLWHRVEAA